jgi:putative addiction module killer protein
MQLKTYLTVDKKDVFQEWLNVLRDTRGSSAIVRRLDRLQQYDQFGDHKFCRDGVWELRIDTGPGYRVYYGKDGNMVILLLCGGDKGTQDKDITNAARYWADYLERKEHEQEK